VRNNLKTKIIALALLLLGVILISASTCFAYATWRISQNHEEDGLFIDDFVIPPSKSIGPAFSMIASAIFGFGGVCIIFYVYHILRRKKLH